MQHYIFQFPHASTLTHCLHCTGTQKLVTVTANGVCCQEMATSNTLEKVPHPKQHLMQDKKFISYKKYGLQYVRETENALHMRMNGHRSDIKTRKTEKPVAAHFCQPEHTMEDLQVRGIEKIHAQEHHTVEKREREKESFWIFTLRTLSPKETGRKLFSSCSLHVDYYILGSPQNSLQTSSPQSSHTCSIEL